MTNDPLVSIAVISFNQVRYLRQCLDGALAQTHKNIEIVVNDDFSTDGSWELLQEYMQQHPGVIRGFRNEHNFGLIGNREANLANTRGEFIAWLDADDLAYPMRISTQVAYLQAHPECSACYFNMDLFRGLEPPSEQVYGEHRKPLEGDHRTLIKNENFIMSSSICYRADAIGRRGYASKWGETYSDWHFFVALGRQGRINYIDEILGGYRRHSSAATASSSRIDSGVRKRREMALNAMYEQMPGDSDIIGYALARFYVSQLRGAMKQGEVGAALRYAGKLAGTNRHGLAALRDRLYNKNLLPTFE